MKVVLLAPIGTSLYSLAVAQLVSMEKNMDLAAILVRSPWSFARLRSEWRRDGVRILRKIANKWLLRAEPAQDSGQEQLLAVLKGLHMEERDLFTWSQKRKVPIKSVTDFNSPASFELLKNAEPDLMVFTGGGLLRKEILNAAKLGVLNCHSGWLPQYRGMDVVEWSILQSKGKKPQLGLSLHLMDQGVDTGPILLQHKVALAKGESIEKLRARMEGMMPGVMLNAVRGIRDGKLNPRPQQLGEGRQYFVMHKRLRQITNGFLS
jgi:methionyl-tRNA formyltransferase